MSESVPWKVSIIGHGETDPRTLLAHPQNPKIHPPEYDAVLDASLGEVGWLRFPLLNRRTGHLLDGHWRVKRAIARGERTVPYDLCDIAEEDEGKVLLLLDPTAGLAEPHPERWAALRASVRTDEPALAHFFGQYAARQGWASLGDEQSGGPGHGAVDEAEVPEERLAQVRERWPVQPGEIWQAGRHRLMCDDCLNPDAVAALLAGAVPTMVLADPPCGVNIVGANGFVGGGEAYNIPRGGVKRDTRKRVSGGQRVKDRTGQYPIERRGEPTRATFAGWQAIPGQHAAKYAPVAGDSSPEVARHAVHQFLTTYPQAAQVWWGANYYTEALPGASCWLVWDKETTGNFADCELAWTNHGGAVRKFTYMWNGMLREGPRERRWHPTQKPAALMAWVYEVLGEDSDVVLDPFLGSGPSLIAAEQRGRTLYGLELSADYVAIALERWHILTSETPQRVV